MVIDPETVAPLAGAVIDIAGNVGGVMFATVTLTGADVIVPPVVSRATAVNVCVHPATAVESHDIWYGLRRHLVAEIRSIEFELNAGYLWGDYAVALRLIVPEIDALPPAR